jgi:hypothetical protein
VSVAPVPLTAAWQRALAAEQRAAFGYPLLGPQLTGGSAQLARACSSAHEALRDSTAQAIAAAGLAPVDPQADYPDLYPVTGAGRAAALAVRLEDGCAAAWRYLYLEAASHADRLAQSLRPTAQQALTASAVRAVRWRAISTPSRPTAPFPGT